MGIATSNGEELRISVEPAFGSVTPNPMFAKMRITSESIVSEFTNTQSEELRSDRARADSVRVGSAVSGDIQFELSAKSFDGIIQAALCGIWTYPSAGKSIVKNGVYKPSFVIQKNFTDADSALRHNFYGVRIDQLSLTLTPGEIVTGSVSVMGKVGELVSTAFDGQSDFPYESTSPMNAANNVQSITLDGASSDWLNSLTINVANNLRALNAIGSLGPVAINYGVMDITGDISIYFQNSTTYNKFVNNTAIALIATIQDADNNYYKITIPRLKLETADITAGGLDQDLTIDATYRAMYDPITQCQIMMERNFDEVPLWDVLWDVEWV